MERFWMTTRGLEPNELGAWVRYADAQRALDAEREKVKELVANQAEYEKCTDEQITALNQGCLDYEKQIATLQAQLADRDAMILQMGEQAAVLAKENMAVKAQLRQVEGERDRLTQQLHTLYAKHPEDSCYGAMPKLRAEVANS